MITRSLSSQGVRIEEPEIEAYGAGRKARDKDHGISILEPYAVCLVPYASSILATDY